MSALPTPVYTMETIPLSMERTAQIEVRELKPELLSDYLKFFDKAFSDFPHWAGCYCGFYDTPGNDWDATAKAGPEHRAARSERIGNGRAQGLLARTVRLDARAQPWLSHPNRFPEYRRSRSSSLPSGENRRRPCRRTSDSPRAAPA